TPSATPSAEPTGTAEPTDPPAGSDDLAVTLSAGKVGAGGKLTVEADGLEPGEDVNVVLHSKPVLLARVPADAKGHLSVVVTVPVSTVAGKHQIVVTGATSQAEGRAALTVVAADDLAKTGSDIGGLALAALLLVLAGVTIVVARSRRGDASA
ncbi:MAG: hypothetical protein AAGC49_10190, partial [Brevundimonas sp.]